MEIIIAVLIGYMLGSTTPKKIKEVIFRKANSVYDYFASPVTEKLEMDWTVRQFFKLFSEKMSERWYEAVAYLRVNVWEGLACAFGLISLIQYSCINEEMTNGRSKVFLVIGTASNEELVNSVRIKAQTWLTEVNKDRKDKYFTHQWFIAGSNVVDSVF